MSLSKRLIAGGEGPSFYGGEIQYTVPSNGADTTFDLGFKPDTLWLFPRPEGSSGISQGGQAGYNYVIDRDFLTDTQQINDGSNWYNGSGDMVDWNDTGFTLKQGSGAYGNEYHWYSDSKQYMGVAFQTSDTGVSNTDGDATSTVYSNSESNVSKFSFTSGGSNTTVGHGLGTTPEFVMLFWLDNYTTATGNRSQTCRGQSYWYNSSSSVWKTGLNQALEGGDSTPFYFDADSTTITLDNLQGGGSQTGDYYFGYAFASKAGFSKYNSFTGNGSTTTRSVAGNLDFDPVSTFYNRGAGDDLGAVFLGTRESGSIGDLPKWIRGYDNSIGDRSASIYILDPGEYIRYDHRTNKRVLFNSARVQESGYLCNVLTFGGDNFYQYEK
jgi:hypothetical protein